MEEITENQIDAVIKALESPKHKWRTVSGVAHETNLDSETVLKVISKLRDKIVRSAYKSSDNEDLYTTRHHYETNTSFSERVLSAFKNRLD